MFKKPKCGDYKIEHDSSIDIYRIYYFALMFCPNYLQGFSNWREDKPEWHCIGPIFGNLEKAKAYINMHKNVHLAENALREVEGPIITIVYTESGKK